MRGLNSRAKCTTVRTVIHSASPCIVCIQETKMIALSSSLVTETLGSSFSKFFFLPADGTRGGILLAWRPNMIALSDPCRGEHHITALASSLDGAHHWWLTGVYGPQGDDDKIAFLGDLSEVRSLRAGPWILGGDFNMISGAADKNNSRLNHRVMSRFRRFLADEELRDIYLHGRRYTWSNERGTPTLTRIDRVISNSAWEALHPHCMLRCLSSAASDHAPLLLDCTARSPGTRRFHFERFWPRTDGYT